MQATQEMPTAFVAGATGYTGREVVRLLRERGVPTVAHVRPDSPRLAAWRALFEPLGATVDATPWTDEAMSATLVRLRPALVFALLGTTRARMRAARARGTAESYDAVDYGLTSMLLRAARASGAAPRFVYLSATAVREGSRNPYIAARARTEREVRESGLPFIIARPSFVTGADREEPRPLERLAARFADAALGVAAHAGARRLAARYRSTTAARLAGALVRLALDPSVTNVAVESEALVP